MSRVPLTGHAWIETYLGPRNLLAQLGRVPLTGHAWIETCSMRRLVCPRRGRVPLTGHAWIETSAFAASAIRAKSSRAPHGARVD